MDEEGEYERNLVKYCRSPSQGSLLSGCRSRCHIVIRGAFPLNRVHQGLEQLIQLYCLAGFDREELNSISSQILNSHTYFCEDKKTVNSLTFCAWYPVCHFAASSTRAASILIKLTHAPSFLHRARSRWPWIPHSNRCIIIIWHELLCI